MCPTATAEAAVSTGMGGIAGTYRALPLPAIAGCADKYWYRGPADVTCRGPCCGTCLAQRQQHAPDPVNPPTDVFRLLLCWAGCRRFSLAWSARLVGLRVPHVSLLGLAGAKGQDSVPGLGLPSVDRDRDRDGREPESGDTAGGKLDWTKQVSVGKVLE